MLKTLLLLGCVATTCSLQAQDSTAGPYLVPPASTAAIVSSPADQESRLYNGVEHNGYNYKIKGFAYFQQPAKQKGTIGYDGLTFTGVPMWYDLVKDQVIIQHYNGFSRIGLVPEKVSAFTIGTHRFIRLVGDSLSLPTGFYELLYQGQSMAVARFSKTIHRDLKQEVEEDFRQQTVYYVRVKQVWHLVKSNAGLLAAFEDDASAVKKHLRKESIRFKNNPTGAIASAAAFYDASHQ